MQQQEETQGATSIPRVAVIVLNWNGRVDTLRCLASLDRLTWRNAEIWVVDNGSTDGSCEAISQAHPNANLVQTGTNLGYAGGNNAGIRQALRGGAEFVFLLNNDAMVAPDVIDNLVAAATARPDGAVFGAKIYYLSDPKVIWYAGGAVRGAPEDCYHVGVGSLDDGSRYSEIAETDYVCGCAFFVPAWAFREIGLLDERFFLTYEEADWCFRARRRGYRCMFVPGAHVWHQVSASFGGSESLLMSYFMTRNRLLWLEHHFGRARAFYAAWDETRKWARTAFRRVFSLQGDNGSRLKRVWWAVNSAPRKLKASLYEGESGIRALALRDYVLRRFGDCPPAVRIRNTPPSARH